MSIRPIIGDVKFSHFVKKAFVTIPSRVRF